MKDLKQAILNTLAVFSPDKLRASAVDLLNTLGYRSDRFPTLPNNTPETFIATIEQLSGHTINREKALVEEWEQAHILFQMQDSDIRQAGGQLELFESTGNFDGKVIESYVFAAVRLRNPHYTRTALAQITRAVNRLFPMPVIILFVHGDTLTLAIIERRLNKQDSNRDVLEKVTQIKDIRLRNPHRAHTEILNDLALPVLSEKHECNNFVQLHAAWRKTLDTNELNKKFYRELADWYFWALEHVDFPDDIEKDAATRKATNVIRLLTRLIFCWFLKEKGLIPDALFSERRLKSILKSLNDSDSSFYLAILQNLFFGTLNQRMNAGEQEFRRFAKDGSIGDNKEEYGVKNLYRYQALFAVPEDAALELFEDIPFLNGGLFDCLDKEDDSGKVLYVDGFTRNSKKRPNVPNFLFFSDYRTLDLSDAYGDQRRRNEKVRGLIRLLDSYKFTVTENTPIDEEIALDPELLGKVFENLLASYNPETGTTARKQTGSFYTPREIVNYMVDESLIAYLEGQLKKNVPRLVDMNDLSELLRDVFAYTEKQHPFDDQEVDALIDAIDTCKILDPACGSGAFPMGILHKLVFTLGKLDPGNVRWKQRQLDKLDSTPMREELERTFRDNDDDYGRKLYLIENCIYGVDIQPIAIQISKLRFFISLLCDQRTSRDKAMNCGVRPLPNLETKFVAANTLISLDKGQDNKGNLLLFDQRLPDLEKQLKDIRHKHFAAQRRKDKLDLQKKDCHLRKQIASVLADDGMSPEAARQLATWAPYDQNTSAPFFDPEWMFGITTGFDVVIGNPPYVQIQKLPEEAKVAYARQGFTTFSRTADLYCLFYELGSKVLAAGGFLFYISSNKFMRAGYGKALRQFFANRTTIRQLVDFGELPVFEAGTDPCILLYHNAESATDAAVTIAAAKTVQDIADVSALVRERGFTCQQSTLSEEGWTLECREVIAILDKLKANGTPLGELVAGRFYRGILTGFNEAFVIDQTTHDRLIAEDPKSAEVIKPWLRGQDIKRWHGEWHELYLINLVSSANKDWPWSNAQRETDAEMILSATYPAIHRHLMQWRRQLVARDDQGRFFWELRSCVYHEDFETSKFIYPDIAKLMRGFLDAEGYFSGNTTYFIPDATPVVAACLNSRIFDWYARHHFQALGDPWNGGRLRFFSQYMQDVPIPPADSATQAEVDRLVTALQQEPLVQTEAELDARVAHLYGLTESEYRTILTDTNSPDDFQTLTLEWFGKINASP